MPTLRVMTLCASVPLFVAACFETVTQSYATHAEAAADSAIARGWIPAFVPATATEIKEAHDIDTNERWLRFRIPAGDTAFLATRLPLSADAREGRKPPRFFGDWAYELNDPPGMTPRSSLVYFRFEDSVSGASCGALDSRNWFVYARSCTAETPASSVQTPPDSTPAPLEQSSPIQTFGKVMPVDEALKDSSLLAFRTELLAIIQRRDTRALLNVVAQDVMIHFGDERGSAELRRQWQPESADSPLWEFIDKLLRNGGRFRKPDLFVAPYKAGALAHSPDQEYLAIAVDSNVPVRADSSATATVVGTLTYDVVRLTNDPWHPESKWLPIDIGGGRKGFAPAAAMGGSLGPNIGIERRGGRWVIAFILEGGD